MALTAAGYRQVRASYGSVLLPLWEQDGQRIGALANRARLSKQTMTGEIRKVVRAGDIATVLNSWRLDGTGPDGTPVRMSGTSADVMRRRADGTWGILIDDPWGAS